MPGYVLIVERDGDLQQRIGAALREAGYELAAETDLQWARRSIAVRRPDAIVLDTQLGEDDGFRLADELRRSDETRGVPILFLATTAHRGVAHRAEARRRFAPADYVALIELGAERSRRGGGPEAAQGFPWTIGRFETRALLPRLADLMTVPLPGMTPPAVPAERAPEDPAQQREGHEVEDRAQTMTSDPGTPGFTGTLKRTPFAQVLQRLYVTRATGSLLLAHEEAKKIVDVADGYPVSVRSNVVAECLGQLLLEKRLITREALAESIARMHKEKRQQGQILVEMDVLSPYNLRRALVEQLEAKLLEVFSWPDGKFLFRPGGRPAAQAAARLERTPATLILDGIRRHYDPGRQAGVLDRYAGRFIVLSADPMLRLQEITSDPDELAFIDGLDGTRLLEAILQEATIPNAKARLLLVALAESGMIQPHETTSKTPAAPAAPPSPARAPTPPPEPLAPLGSGELAMMLQMARTQDHFWALGVERNATAPEIDRAYQALARSFHADRYRLSPDEDRRMAAEMFQRLTEAHAVLQAPARRRAYVAALATVGDAEPAATPADSQAGSLSRVTPPPENAQGAAAGLYQAGLDHLRARRHHDAVEALRQAARLVPNHADYRAALGWALFRQAPADARAARAALAELRRATQIDERHRGAAQHLAEIYAQTGRTDAALAELERLLGADPAATELAEEIRRLRGD